MSDFNKLDTLLHKTHITVLQVLWFQFFTGMMNHSVKEATVGVEVAGNRERGWKKFDKGGEGWESQYRRGLHKIRVLQPLCQLCSNDDSKTPENQT